VAQQANSARAASRAARDDDELTIAEGRAIELEAQLGVWQSEHTALAADMARARDKIMGLEQQVRCRRGMGGGGQEGAGIT
jgi:hypothetical protein